ncbi:MAG: translesion error-prone DNA polymerase V autoproteolytic subunit [Renibacterium salmoninarum]|nr:translesion error-prone DNA polymerase V autoproteolytic subunit [Renibacterium salmoninarum]
MVSAERLIGSFPQRVPAGYPSPSQDYENEPIDLTKELVKDQLATFLMTVAGTSMTGAGILDNDKILIDRSLEARHGDVVVAVLDDEFTVKRLKITHRGIVLASENPDQPDIVVPELSELRIWGVVTWSIHKHR